MKRLQNIGLLLCFCLIDLSVLATTPLEKQLQQAKHDTTRIRICLALAQNYYMGGQFEKSLFYAKQGLSLAVASNTTIYHAQLHKVIAINTKKRGNIKEAIVVFEKALYWAQRHKQLEMALSLRYAITTAYVDLSRNTGQAKYHKLAARHLMSNLKVIHQAKVPRLEISYYHLIVAFYEYYNNDSIAHNYQGKALSLELKYPLRDLTDTLFIWTNSVNYYLYEGQTHKAQYFLDNMLRYQKRKQETPYFGYALYGCIESYMKFEYFDKADSILKIVFADKKLLESLSEWRMMLYCHSTTIYLHKLNYKAAIQTHQKAMKYYNEKYPLWIRLQMLTNQEKLFLYKHEYKEAYQLQKRIYAIKDSLTAVRYVFDLSTSQERLEAENRERTLQEQIRQNDLENQKKIELLEKSKQVQILSWLLIIFLAIIIATISYQVKKIKLQSKQLAQANENKRSLLALIGHDLRAPIIALYNSLKLIQISAPDAKNWASKQLPRVNALLLATDNLLYWSHSQQEDKRTNPSKVNLFEIVAEVLDLLDANLEQAQINVENKLTTSTVIKVDQNHLRIILRNVIQNAVKFTPTQGSIFISSNELPKNIEIIIRDTGDGFEESKKDLSKQGTRLGLQVIEALTKANKGSVKIVSQKEIGTSVYLTFVKA
jgi:signal transduction histidine kinase